MYKRKSEALAEMGRFSAAVEAVRRGLSSIDIDTSSSTSNPSQKRKHKEVAAKAHEVLNERLKMAATMQRLGEEGEACLARKDYKRANALFARLLTFTRAPAVSLGQAQCQIHLGSVSLALSRTLAVLRVAKKSGNSEIMGKALLVRAAALMANADFPAAVDCLRAVVRSDPDSSRGKASLRSALAMSRTVQDAKSKQAKRDFDAAVESLTSAILIAGWDDWSARQGKERGEEGKEGKEEGNEKGEEKKEKEGGLDFPLVSALGASIFAARAEARLRLGRLEECLVDADVAIYCAADCKEAWKSKANVGSLPPSLSLPLCFSLSVSFFFSHICPLTTLLTNTIFTGVDEARSRGGSSAVAATPLHPRLVGSARPRSELCVPEGVLRGAEEEEAGLLRTPRPRGRRRGKE